MLYEGKVYKKMIEAKGIMRWIWSVIRRLIIIMRNDPVCIMEIHGRLLKIPLSHSLPVYLYNFKFYDRLPKRLADFIRLKENFLCCIDVGANIGDTIASFYKLESDKYLAIEPNPKYSELLISNWSWNPNVKVITEICSDKNGTDQFKVLARNGTASIVPARGGFNMKRRTLDNLLQEHSFAKNANIIKIDTDGHDFEVIRGSIDLIARNHLAVLFECDVFGNINYFEDCLRTLRIFESLGYKHMIIYDNYGVLMGRHSLSELNSFRSLLYYQLTGNFYYFDILIMRNDEINEFYKLEIEYFRDNISDQILRKAAHNAIQFIENVS